MTARRKTRGEVEMEELLGRLDPSSERYRVLSAARDFKASWVELGERLTETREAEQYKEWGYDSFEAYCRTELRLKAETANKLTRSFSFLRDHTPQALETRQQRELPPLDVVDLLSRARERSQVSEAQLRDISKDVFAGEPPTRGEVIKRFRELDPMAFKAPERPKAEAGPAGEGDLRKALLLAERLQSLLPSEVSRAAKDGVKVVVRELQELFETARSGTLEASKSVAGRIARAPKRKAPKARRRAVTVG